MSVTQLRGGQCDQIRRNFAIWVIFKALGKFFFKKRALNLGAILGEFLLRAKLFIFNVVKLFVSDKEWEFFNFWSYFGQNF